MFEESLEECSKTAIMNGDAAEFRNDKKADTHYEQHRMEFDPPISMKDYINKARLLLNEADSEDIDLFYRSDGSYEKYSLSRNELVIGDPDGTMKTFFRPVEKEDYWRGEHDRNL